MTPQHSVDDWISSKSSSFEQRLGRTSIAQRPQYLHQRAQWLMQRGDLGEARELLDRALSLPKLWSVYEKSLLATLARLERTIGNASDAETVYRRVLSTWPGDGGADGGTEIDLAEILIDRDAIDEATVLLNSWLEREEEDAFDIQLFRHAVCAARIAEIQSDKLGAKQWAIRALDVAKRPDEFSKHPGVGVARPSADLLEWVHRAACVEGTEPPV